MSETRTARRRGGSSAKPAEVRAPFISRQLGTFNVLADEGLSLIEANADVILRDTGMDFTGDPEILTIFRAAGCDVQGERGWGVGRHGSGPGCIGRARLAKQPAAG